MSTKPVDFDSYEAVLALGAMVKDLASDVSAVQWAVLTEQADPVYRTIAKGIPVSKGIVAKLAGATYLPDEHVARMLVEALQDSHRERNGRFHPLTGLGYDIDAAMAIDPASILAAGAA